MKIVCLSDTHLRHNFEVPTGDLLIHAGDALYDGTDLELVAFNRWFSSLPHRYKILVPGNHDRVFQTEYYHARSLLDSSIIYCEDRLIEIQGLRIYGSPWNDCFGWAFYKSRTPRRKKWEQIPENIDILITHIPPYGIGDKIDGFNIGCPELLKVVQKRAPKYHIYGHVHESYGKRKLWPTWFYNSATCNEDYKPTNRPLVFELS